MTEPFPMLAAKADLTKLRYPILGFPKVDGIRAVVHNGHALSRKLLLLPNQYLQGYFSNPSFQGLDGELVVGSPTDPACMRNTTSGVMSQDGVPDFKFLVFDCWEPSAGATYHERYLDTAERVRRLRDKRVVMLHPKSLASLDDVLEYEAAQLELGYEGVILRTPDGRYKHGRSTVREGGMLKIKRFEDSEAEVLAVIEEQFNGNEAQKDNLGRTKRSSAKAGKVGKGRAGAITVRDVKHGWEFEVGTGLNDATKAEWWAWWNNGSPADKRLVKYSYFPVGMKDKPRHPKYLGWRHPMDT